MSCPHETVQAFANELTRVLSDFPDVCPSCKSFVLSALGEDDTGAPRILVLPDDAPVEKVWTAIMSMPGEADDDTAAGGDAEAACDATSGNAGRPTAHHAPGADDKDEQQRILQLLKVNPQLRDLVAELRNVERKNGSAPVFFEDCKAWLGFCRELWDRAAAAKEPKLAPVLKFDPTRSKQ